MLVSTLSELNNNVKNQNQTVVVFAKEIRGIVYYIDDYKNVYNTEDVMREIENPKIIAQYEKRNDDTYIIPSLGLI